MRPQWDNPIIQFNTAIEQIRSVMPVLPATFTTAQGILTPTESVLQSLDELKSYIQFVNDSPDVDPLLLGIHQSGVLSGIAAITTSASNLASNPNVAYIDQIAQNSWGIRASLVWIAPRQRWSEHIEEKISNFDFDAKLELLSKLTKSYREGSEKLQDAAKETKLLAESVAIVAEQIKGYEREASTAKTNAEASAAVAVANKDVLVTQLATLDGGVEQQKQLLEEILSLKETAVSTLESTSKVALATSFSNRKDALGKQQYIWQIAFASGIFALLLVGLASACGWMILPPVVIDNKIELGPILTRLALVGPIIWFTWFSVRHLSTTTRLIEDYAFKEASALAFVGYQREMKDDVEMIKLLRESAIHNFGNQPTRVFDKNDPASPVHELFAKALDTGGIDKVVELIKALRQGK
jgi:hypothetical protein